MEHFINIKYRVGAKNKILQTSVFDILFSDEDVNFLQNAHEIILNIQLSVASKESLCVDLICRSYIISCSDVE